MNLFGNKYKPQSFSDYIVNQETVNIIDNFLSIDNLNILLIGSSASGKTTIVNSIIHEYYRGNSLKQQEENILYINNLQEQGINYYRTTVKYFCQSCSNIKGKKKMVVMDDLDLLNEQSQQVFRNFIDSYKNVFFVASCTTVQKVIDNIQSRLNIIKIKKVEYPELWRFITKIEKTEKIDIDEASKKFIIQISNYSIQVLIHFMEKFYLIQEPIRLENATDLCSTICFYVFEEYITFLKNRDLVGAIKYINHLSDQGGYSVIDILDTFFIFIKLTDLLTEDQKYQIIPIICKFISCFYTIHENEIELAFFTNNLIECF